MIRIFLLIGATCPRPKSLGFCPVVIFFVISANLLFLLRKKYVFCRKYNKAMQLAVYLFSFFLSTQINQNANKPGKIVIFDGFKIKKRRKESPVRYRGFG